MSYNYRFNIRGVEFRVYYQDGWVVESGKRYTVVRKARDLLSPKVARFALSVVREVLCGDDRECARKLKEELGETDVKNVIWREVVSKVRGKLRAPSEVNVNSIVLPIWFTKSDGQMVAAVLTYESISDEKGGYREPYLLVVVTSSTGETRLEKVRLVDAMWQGLYIDNTVYLIHAPALQPGYDEEVDITDLERIARRALDEALNKGIVIPDAWSILRWYDKVKNDPIPWIRWVVEIVADWLRRMIWRVYSHTHVRVFALRHAAYMFAFAFSFLPHTTFRGRPGSGKSYHVGILTRLLPYSYLLTKSTRAALDRIRTFAAVVGIQEVDRNNWDIVEVIIRAFEKYGSREIADGKRTISFVGGVALYIADVGHLQELDESGAASTRMMEHYLRVDPRMRKVDAPRDYVDEQYYYKGRAPNGEEVELRAKDLWALETALFLAAAHKVHMKYKELVRIIDAEGWRGVDVLPRTLQIHMPLITMAELLGAEYIEALKEWLTKQPKEPNHTLLMLAAALNYIINNYDKEPFASAVRRLVGKEEGDDNTPVLLVPMGAIVEAVSLLEQTSVDSITIRRKTDQDNTFVMVDVWKRGRAPEVFKDARRLPDWIKINTDVGQKLLVLAKSVNRYYRHHLILTPKVVELLVAEAMYDTPEDTAICEVVAPHLDILLREVDPRSAGILPECAKSAKSGGSPPPEGEEKREALSSENLPSTQRIMPHQSSENFTSTTVSDATPSNRINTASSGENGGVENVSPATVEQAQPVDKPKREVYKAEDLFRDI